MSQQTFQIIIALIGIIVPTMTVLLTWKQSATKLSEVHQVVNSRLDGALASIDALKSEIRRLNASSSNVTSREIDNKSHVTMDAGGRVSVSQPNTSTAASLVKSTPPPKV